MLAGDVRRDHVEQNSQYYEAQGQDPASRAQSSNRARSCQSGRLGIRETVGFTADNFGAKETASEMRSRARAIND